MRRFIIFFLFECVGDEMKTNWDNLAFCIVVMIFVVVMGYLFLTGRAFE